MALLDVVKMWWMGMTIDNNLIIVTIINATMYQDIGDMRSLIFIKYFTLSWGFLLSLCMH